MTWTARCFPSATKTFLQNTQHRNRIVSRDKFVFRRVSRNNSYITSIINNNLTFSRQDICGQLLEFWLFLHAEEKAACRKWTLLVGFICPQDSFGKELHQQHKLFRKERLREPDVPSNRLSEPGRFPASALLSVQKLWSVVLWLWPPSIPAPQLMKY